jgi:hypothetical protein
MRQIASAGLTTEIDAYLLWRQERHSLQLCGLVICLTEAFGLIVFGSSLALGNYGPMVLPVQFYYATISGSTGVSMFSTLVLALFVREEWRQLSTPHPRRSIWIEYREVLCFFAILLPGSDLATTIIILSQMKSAFSVQQLMLLQLVIICIGHVALALYYFAQARTLRAQLKRYITVNNKTRDEKGTSIDVIGRVAFWLSATGVCLLMYTLSSLVVLAYSFVGINVTIPYYVFVLFTLICTRVGIAFCKIRTIGPNQSVILNTGAISESCFFRHSERVAPSSPSVDFSITLRGLQSRSLKVGIEIIEVANSGQLLRTYTGSGTMGEWANPLDPLAEVSWVNPMDGTFSS